MESYLSLQNGSDIRGVAMGENVTFSPQIAAKISFAFGKRLLFIKPEAVVSVGYDSRLTGVSLCEAICAGLVYAGCNVVKTGLSSTPAMFMTCVDKSFCADGAIMITASHLPKERNGMKFFTPQGGYGKTDIKAILLAAAEAPDIPLAMPQKIANRDYMADYSTLLCNKIITFTGKKMPFTGLKILVDAGGGAGGFYAERVLKPLGADTSGSLYLTPDGTFSGHIPNPEDDVAIKEISDAVRSSGADFGVIFDTDVDRAAFIGKGGVILHKNKLIALSAAILVQEHPNSTIVTDSITSTGLKQFIEQELHMVHHRFKRGYKNVIDEAKRLTDEGVDAPLAIETSGHAALSENYFLDDGAYLATRILAALVTEKSQNRDILHLIAKLPEPAESLTKRYAIEGDDFADYGKAVLADLTSLVAKTEGFQIEAPNYEGVRVNVCTSDANGWFLLRMSLHDPVLALDVESEYVGGLSHICCFLDEFLTGYIRLK